MKKKIGSNITPQYDIFNNKFEHYRITIIMRNDVLQEMRKTISPTDYRIIYYESKKWGKTLP